MFSETETYAFAALTAYPNLRSIVPQLAKKYENFFSICDILYRQHKRLLLEHGLELLHLTGVTTGTPAENEQLFLRCLQVVLESEERAINALIAYNIEDRFTQLHREIERLYEAAGKHQYGKIQEHVDAIMFLQALAYMPKTAADFGSVRETKLSTGIEDFDLYLNGGYRPGSILSILGDTGAQKTGLSLHLLISFLSKHKNLKGVFLEKEMSAEEIAARINKMQVSEELKKRLYIVGPDQFRTPGDILGILIATRSKIFVLDYLTQMEADSDNLTIATLKAINQIKAITHKTQSIGIIISQMVKSATKKLKFPELNDIEWSGTIKHVSSYVLGILYPRLYDSTYPSNALYCRFLKNRYGPLSWSVFDTDPTCWKYHLYDAEKRDLAVKALLQLLSDSTRRR